MAGAPNLSSVWHKVWDEVCHKDRATSVAQSQDQKYGTKTNTSSLAQGQCGSVAAVAANVAARLASGATMVTSMPSMFAALAGKGTTLRWWCIFHDF